VKWTARLNQSLYFLTAAPLSAPDLLYATDRALQQPQLVMSDTCVCSCSHEQSFVQQVLLLALILYAPISGSQSDSAPPLLQVRPPANVIRTPLSEYFRSTFSSPPSSSALSDCIVLSVLCREETGISAKLGWPWPRSAVTLVSRSSSIEFTLGIDDFF